MKIIIKVFVLALILSSCGSKATNSTKSETSEGEKKDSIENMSETEMAKLYGIYMIKEFEGKKIEDFNIVGKSPFILFDEENKAYSTSVGCNQISGSYEASDSTIVFKPGISTMMACSDSLEFRYLEALTSINRYEKFESELELYKDDSLKILLVSAIK